MTALKLDPLGQSLLRQLAEADEARRASRLGRVDRVSIDVSKNFREWVERDESYEALLADFLEHLEYMPSEIDSLHYHDLWRHMQTLNADERNIGRLFDVAQDIAGKYLELWRGEK